MLTQHWPTVCMTIAATLLATAINHYAPVPEGLRTFMWIVVALGPWLLLAFALSGESGECAHEQYRHSGLHSKDLTA